MLEAACLAVEEEAARPFTIHTQNTHKTHTHTPVSYTHLTLPTKRIV